MGLSSCKTVRFFGEINRNHVFHNNVENWQGQITVPIRSQQRDWLVIYNQPMAKGGLSEFKIPIQNTSIIIRRLIDEV